MQLRASTSGRAARLAGRQTRDKLRATRLPACRFGAGVHASLAAASRDRCGQRPRPVLARFKLSPTQPQQEQEYIQLPLDYTELLGLIGRQSYLFCDITGAYDDLLALPAEEGFSKQVLEGRRELLDLVKEAIIFAEGKVQADRAVNIPMSLLPSALVLLTQIDQHDLVMDLAPPLLENWEVRKAFKRDILLALALACCGCARDMFAAEQTATGCALLDEALQLLQGAGSPALAPRLVEDIQAGLAGLEVPCVLDQLRAPATDEAVAARKRSVATLRRMLASPTQVRAPDGQVVDADYVRLAMSAMGAAEIVEAADWAAVARNPRAVPWAWPGVQQVAAMAHITAGFVQRQPEHVKQARSLLTSTGTPLSAECLVARGVCEVLLGNTDAAVGCMKQAASAPLDPDLSWPISYSAAGRGGQPEEWDEEDTLLASMRMPGPQEVFRFVCSHSPEDERDLLPGLCLLTELWLSKVSFAAFQDAAADRPSTSLVGYYSSMRVEQVLHKADSMGERVAEQLGSMARVLQGGMQSLAAASQRVSQPAVGVEQGGGAQPALFGGLAALAESVGSSVSSTAAQGVAKLPGRRRLKQLAGSAALVGAGALVVAAIAARRGGAAVGAPSLQLSQFQGQQPGGGVAMVAPAAKQPRVMDAPAAERLLQRWQRAKASALGPHWDASALSDVLAQPLLGQEMGKAQQLAASGWFYRYQLWRMHVSCIEPSGSNTATVRAELEEACTLHGIDGRQGDGYHCAYDVEYKLMSCADGRWRVAGIKLLSKRNVGEGGDSGGLMARLRDGMSSMLGGGSAKQ